MTDAPLVRRFVLHGDAEARQLFEFLSQRKELMEKRGKVFQVVVSEYSPSRTLAQQARMWVAILKPTADQVRNPRLTDKGWNFVLKQMWLPEISASGVSKWKYLPNGDRELSMSTTDLTEDEMDAYLHTLEGYVVSEFSVMLPANPRDL